MAILVTTSDERDGVRVYAGGHASSTNGKPEKDRVCAAVSALMITLAANVRGEWGGLNSGRASCYVPAGDLRLAEFTLSGLRLVQIGYPEHLTIRREDTRLFQGSTWSNIQFPVIKPSDPP